MEVILYYCSHRPTPSLQTSCHDNDTTPTISCVSPALEEESSQVTNTASQVTNTASQMTNTASTTASHVTTTAIHVTTTTSQVTTIPSDQCETSDSSMLPWQPSLEGPRLSLASDWLEPEEGEDDSSVLLTPVERLQMRFIKHTQQVGGAKPHPQPLVEDSNSIIMSDELISQLSSRPG